MLEIRSVGLKSSFLLARAFDATLDMCYARDGAGRGGAIVFMFTHARTCLLEMGPGGAVNKKETCSSSCILSNLQVQTAIGQSKMDKAKRLPVETEKAGRPKQKRTDFFLYRVMISRKSLWHGQTTILIHSCGKIVGGFFWWSTSQLEKAFFSLHCYLICSSLLNCCTVGQLPDPADGTHGQDGRQ